MQIIEVPASDEPPCPMCSGLGRVKESAPDYYLPFTYPRQFVECLLCEGWGVWLDDG